MNLPNKLSVIRVILIPLFLVFLLIEKIPFHLFAALFIFAVASVTDAFDGSIARKRNLVTDFGKFLDPLADKALVMAALVGFIECGFIGSVPVIIIIAREFMVSGLRMVCSEKVVIAAGIWGKLKTAFTMAAIIVVMAVYGLKDAGISFGADYLICTILIWAAAALTVISGIQYLLSYWKYIDSDK